MTSYVNGVDWGVYPISDAEENCLNNNSLKTENHFLGMFHRHPARFWQILKQLLKLLTPTFLFLTGKGDAVLRQEIFKKTSLMCLLKWNLIKFTRVSSVAQISLKHCRITVLGLNTPQRFSSPSCSSPVHVTSERWDLCASLSPSTSLSCQLHC